MELLEGGVETGLILCAERVGCLYIKANMRYKRWSLALRKEHRLRVFENRVLRRI
jgi:hypothetical protein